MWISVLGSFDMFHHIPHSMFLYHKICAIYSRMPKYHLWYDVFSLIAAMAFTHFSHIHLYAMILSTFTLFVSTPLPFPLNLWFNYTFNLCFTLCYGHWYLFVSCCTLCIPICHFIAFKPYTCQDPNASTTALFIPCYFLCDIYHIISCLVFDCLCLMLTNALLESNAMSTLFGLTSCIHFNVV